MLHSVSSKIDADLLIAGGGPSGLAAAIWAARAGRSVCVIEPKAGVIDKACGEGLMPSAVAQLRGLGVEGMEGRPFRGVRYIDGDAVAEADFPRGPGLGVRRLALHDGLRAAAERAGVRWVEAAVRAVEQDGAQVRVGLSGGGALAGRHLIAADGLRSPIRALLGLGLPPLRPARVGLRQHFQVAPWSDFVEVHWAEGAEAYITPVSEDTVGVAFLISREGGAAEGGGPPMAALLRRFPAIAARLSGAASSPRGAGPFEQRTRARVQGRVLLVGDAAGYLDPLTGEGIKLGLSGAEAAVRAVLSGELRGYERDWARITRRYWWMTDGLLRLSRPRLLRRALVPFLQRAPFVMRAVLAALGDG